MFDSRWDSDSRERDAGSRDLSRGGRGGGSYPRDRDRPDPREVFVGHVDLPRGRDREHVHHRGHDYTLRGSESRTLSAVGAFRAIPANDLRDTFDKPLDPRHSAGSTDYGTRFTCALARDNIFATQFHPEKSADHGLALYRNFLHWKP